MSSNPAADFFNSRLAGQPSISPGNASQNPAAQFFSKPAESVRRLGDPLEGEDRSLFQSTVGAFEYGAADSAEHLIQSTARLTGSEYLAGISASLKEFKESHPEYAPQEVDSVYSLITNPKALAGNVAAGAPMAIATLGSLAIPYAGIPLSLALTYGVEYDRSYQQALQDGASEDEAVKAGHVSGTVQSLLGLAMAGGVLNFASGSAKKVLASALTKDALETIRASGVTGDAVRFVAREAVIGAAQQGFAEYIPNGVYGRPIAPGILDRLAQSALTNVVSQGVFGFGLKGLGLDSSKPTDPTPSTMDTYSRDSMIKQLREEFKLPEEQVQGVTGLVDRRAKMWAAANGKTSEEYYGTHFANAELDDKSGMVLFQEPEKVAGFHSKLVDIVEDDAFQKSQSPEQALSFLRNKGVKQDELLWTGTQELLEWMQRAGIKKVTKDELSNYLKENQVKLDETVLGGKKRTELREMLEAQNQKVIAAERETIAAHDKYQKFIGQFDDNVKLSPEDEAKAKEFNDEAVQKARILDEEDNAHNKLKELYYQGGSETQYSSYKAVGGPSSDYTELLLKFPAKELFTKREIENKILDEHTASQDPYSVRFTDGELQRFFGVEQANGLIRAKAFEKVNVPEDGRLAGFQDRFVLSKNFDQAKVDKELFTPGHFGEIARNTIVHTRFDTRATEKGKVLLVQEIQSDWHQAGRREGYKVTNPEALEAQRKLYEEAHLAVKDLRTKYYDDFIKLSIKDSRLKPEIAAEIEKNIRHNKAEYVARPPADFDRFLREQSDYREASLRSEEALNILHAKEAGVAEGPFSTTYNELALKRLMMEAVEGGHDYVALTTGRQQNQLYGNHEGMDHSELYDTILPKALVKLARSFDKNAKIETINVPGESQFDFSKDIKLADVERLASQAKQQGASDLVSESIWAIGNQMRLGDSFDEASDKVIEKLSPKEKDQVYQVWKTAFEENKTPVLAIKMTDALKKGITDEGFPLFQSNKASTTFLQDGRAIIRALEKPDVSSALHELGHVFRRDLSSEDMTTASKWAGVKEDGIWRVENEEKFARGFEAYLRLGAAPTSEVRSLFDKFKVWMKGIYQTIRGSLINVKLNSEIKGVFDRLFAEDTPSVSWKREQVRILENDAERAANHAKAGSPAYQIYAKTAQLALKSANEELRDLQMALFDPKAKSQGELLSSEAEDLPGKLSGETPERGRFRRNISSVIDTVSELVSMAAPLKKTKGGQLLLEGLNNVERYRKSMRGEFEDKFVQAYSALSEGEIKSLLSTDENGISLLRRLSDPTAVPSQPTADKSQLTPAVRGLVNLFRDINVRLGQEAVRLNVYSNRSDGSVTPFEQPDQQRLGRIPTMDARKAIIDGGGPLFKAIVQAVSKLNPELGNSYDGVAKALQNEFGDPTVRKSGQLENVRKIKYMPDVVKMGGKDYAILHIEPYQLYKSTIDFQSRRLGFIEQFGQNMLDTVGNATLKRVASFLGVSPSYNKDRLVQDLYVAGVDENKIEGKKYRELVTLAKTLNVRVAPDANELRSAIQGVSPNSLDKNQWKKVLTMAKTVQGIDLNQKDPLNVLNDIKRRVSDTTVDVVDSLRAAHAKEGGDPKKFDDVLKVAQGLPYHWLGSGPIAETLKGVSGALGVLQTSTAVAPNLPQVLVQVPQLAGAFNFLKAVQSSLVHYNMTRSQLVALGAINRELFIRGADPGYELETRGANLRKMVAGVTGLKQMNEFNSTVAGEAGRLLADEWRKFPKNFGSGDVAAARTLSLSDGEISSVREGKMSDETFKKVVQNMVSRTQFHNESPFLRGKIENIPLLNMLFAYSSYTLGTTRANVGLLGQLADSVRNRDLPAIFDGTRRLSYLLAGSVGAGVTAQILRQSIKMEVDKPDPKDEGFWNRALAALNETQAFGMTTRLVEPFKYDGGVIERSIIGSMPQVSALAQLFAALKGYGKFGEFTLPDRVGESLKQNTPAAKAFYNWWEGTAYPDQNIYTRVKQESSQFAQSTLGKEVNVGETKLNPEYYPIFKSVSRGDDEGALDQARKFYQTQMSAPGADPQRILLGLRASLVARSPIPFNDVNTVRFILSLPEDKRVQYAHTHLNYMKIVNQVAPLLGR